MRIVDAKFRANKWRYAAQSALAALAVAAALLFFDVVRNPMIIASFGASAFIVFTRPNAGTSSPRYLIGGYVIGIVVGVAVHYATFLPVEHDVTARALHIISGAAAVGISMFLMAVTETEHAPAAGISLGLVLNDWTFPTILFVVLGITVISGLHRIMKPRMMDLI